MKIVLGNEVYALRKGHYASGHLALGLMDIAGESVAELSVDVPGVSRQPDEIILKTYGENQEIAAKIVAAMVLNPTPRHVLVAGCFCPVCNVVGEKGR